ncbi:nicotinate-nucleotide--dimethylbenzimidazole phosphoribosyltransferase [Streptomyces sp. NPDC049577]|uniref:nicotinate-nucleotide--dimethylbenzimidazole phosphoribosyltransferase n=1 Tax=Streptomyces sp. NPDC049577 TaxID=3155153 RepID=UPI00341AD27C
MTDTGRFPGEGQPENAGALPGHPLPADGAAPADAGIENSYFLGHAPDHDHADQTEGADEDDLLLMPGAQGAWAEQPLLQGGTHETGGRDTGSVDYSAVRTAPAQPRRPLHMGPPTPDPAVGGVVRSLADRGPAVPAPAAPEYLDAPHLDAPHEEAQAVPAPRPAESPEVPAQATAEAVVPAPVAVAEPPQAPQVPHQAQPAAEAPAAAAPAAAAEGPEAQMRLAAEAVAPVAAPVAVAESPEVPAQATAEAVVPAPAVVAEVPQAPQVPHQAQPAAEAPAAAAPAAAAGSPAAQSATEAVVSAPAVADAQSASPEPAPATTVPAAVPAAAASADTQSPADAPVAAGARSAVAAPTEPPAQPVADAAPTVVPQAAVLTPAPAQDQGAPEPQAQEAPMAPPVAADAVSGPVEAAPAEVPAPPVAPAVAEEMPAAAPVVAEAPAGVLAPPVAQEAPQAQAPTVAPPAPEAPAEAVLVTDEATQAQAPVETPAAPAVENQPDAQAPAEAPAPAEEPAPEPEAPAPAVAEAVDAPQAREEEPATAEAAPQALRLVPEGPEAPEGPESADATDAPDAADASADAPEAAGEPAEPAGPPAVGFADAERAAVHRVMRERRDIRKGFRTDPIPHEVLLRVLEAAHTAPSVGHSQPWDFVVIRSAETRQAMHELAERQREAYARSLPKGRAKQFKELKIEAILDTPVNIVVTADPTRGGRHTLGRHTQPQMAPYSSALAVENLWLAARAEGLGVGWVSFFDEREMVRELGLPEHLEVVAYLCVGYVDEFPDEPELMQAGWSKRRPLSWVVHEETYGRRALPGEDPHDLLAETLRGIRPLDAKALGEAWERQKRMTKPSGALGMLEIISAQLCGLSRKCPPPIPEPAAVAIFAGDHGVHAQGVTAWPQEVTSQMVGNFLGGGAVCNAFANQVGAEVCVVDVGVAGELPSTPGLLPRKIRPGTHDFTTGPAMTREEALRALEVGIETARDLVTAGNKALLTGEMGIANTTVSAALIAVYTGADPAEITGRGTGINDEMHARKIDVVRRALELHQPDPNDPIGVLAAVGGLEHAALVGLILGGASLRTPVILDGVSAGAAALVARAIAPEALAACIAGHRSAEPGHVAALTKLGLRPLVDLDLRLGEGTGALLALPVVQSAARAMHEVATFDTAGVAEKS